MTMTQRPQTATTGATPSSKSLYEEAVKYIPGGTSRVHYYYEPHPLYASRARGCRLTDVDGVERLDFLNNMTSLIHGHADPVISAAIAEQLERGTAWSEPGEAEVKLAKLLVERVASLDRIRFSNSGTEAVMLAIKLARQFTGRSRLTKFEGHYHGYYDYVQLSVRNTPEQWGPADAPATVPNSGGLADGVVEQVLTVPYNDREAVERLLEKHGRSLAAFILDPLAGMAGMPMPEPGFLDFLTAQCRRHGIVLIYDEVVSFRLAQGGAQQRYGGRPDLTCFGKVIGGGLPVGAVGGRGEIMALLDPSRGPPPVISGGTFSANPLTMVAGYAALERLVPAEFDRLARLGDRLRQGANEVFARSGTKACMVGDGSLFRILPTSKPVKDYRSLVLTGGPAAWITEIHRELLAEGVIIARLGVGCLSTPMGEGEVDAFVAALDRALRRVAG